MRLASLLLLLLIKKTLKRENKKKGTELQIFPVQFSLGGKRERGGVRTGFLFIFVETEIFKRLFPAGGEMAGTTRHEKKMKKLRINTMTKDEE